MLSKYSYSVNMIWPKVFHAPCTSLPLIIPHNCCHKMNLNLKMIMIHCACRAQSVPNCGTWHFILLMHHRTISLIPTHDTSASKGHYMILLPFLPQICQNMFRTLGFEKIWGFAGFSPWTELSLEQGTLESHRGSTFCQWSPEKNGSVFKSIDLWFPVTLAKPKSVMTTWPWRSSSRFSGFKSLWVTESECRYSRAWWTLTCWT